MNLHEEGKKQLTSCCSEDCSFCYKLGVVSTQWNIDKKMADVHSHSYRYWTIKKVKTKSGRTVKPIMTSKAQLAPNLLSSKIKNEF